MPVLGLRVMKQVSHTVDTKQITGGAEMKQIAFGLLTADEEAERHVRENDRRLSEIGPVLEEILQNHWRYWGPNEQGW